MCPLRLRSILIVAMLFICLASLGLGVYFYQQYQALDNEGDAVAPPADVPDVTFCSPEGAPLKLDVYTPHIQDGQALPTLVYVHGGSFTGGDKRKGSSVYDIAGMTERGFLVAAVNYRLAPENRFPAPLEDVKCAVRFLRAHAADYRIDPERIGVWGASAGGYLAAFTGLTGSPSPFDRGEYLEQSSAVRAAADLFGPTDLTSSDFNWLEQFLLNRAFGSTSPQDPFLVSASPVNYVSSSAPPFLILHGDQDAAVPLSQSQRLHDRLVAAGVPSTLVVVKNANHEFAPTGGPISPSRSEITKIMGDFFDRYLLARTNQ